MGERRYLPYPIHYLHDFHRYIGNQYVHSSHAYIAIEQDRSVICFVTIYLFFCVHLLFLYSVVILNSKCTILKKKITANKRTTTTTSPCDQM